LKQTIEIEKIGLDLPIILGKRIDFVTK